MTRSLRLVVGISGGIAAYKAVGVIRAFVLDGHDVHVVATEAALNFVGKTTLEAMSRNPVHVSLYDDVAEVRHVTLGQQADAVVVAPATANALAQIAAGLAPDLLGNVILARRGPLIVAPAMHTEMWENPATVANVATLTSRGVIVVGPDRGALTGADVGVGRMSEPPSIVAATYVAVGTESGDLRGRRILITGGGTREPLDPVRFIGNASSGRQAVALAEAARARGADVDFIHAHMDIDPPSGMNVVSVSTAEEMLDAVRRHADAADVIIMAAAVADYRAETISENKLKKANLGDTPEIRLVKNPDILREIARDTTAVIVGFAAETAHDESELLSLARQKAVTKGAAAIVANSVGHGVGIGSEDNAVVIVSADGRELASARGPKLTVAQRILDVVVELLDAS